MKSEIPPTSPYSQPSTHSPTYQTKKIRVLRWWHIATSILAGIVIGVGGMSIYAVTSINSYEQQKILDSLPPNSTEAIEHLKTEGIDIRISAWKEVSRIACGDLADGRDPDELGFIIDGTSGMTWDDAEFVSETAARFSCPEHLHIFE